MAYNYPPPQLPGQPVTASSSSNPGISSIPPAFRCPLSGHLFCDPVVATDGHTYERNNILHHFQRVPPGAVLLSPKTGQVLPSNFLIANLTLRQAIDEWMRTNPNAAAVGRGAAQFSLNFNGVGGGGGNHGSAMMVVGVPTAGPGGSAGGEYADEKGSILGQVIANEKPWRYSWDLAKVRQRGVLNFECNEWIVRRDPSALETAEPRDLVVISSRPIRTRFGETMETHFKILNSITAWGGPTIGLVAESSSTKHTTTSHLTAENLHQCVEDRGYFLDGDRWFKTPGHEESKLTQFNTASLRENDVVSLILAQDGRTLYFFLNGKQQCVVDGLNLFGLPSGSEPDSLPSTSTSAGLAPAVNSTAAMGSNLYPFLILTGSCDAVEIGVERPGNLVLPAACDNAFVLGA
mmetsp:Transcript_27663/g.69743  ORF Transcript_27663/g.69743 Transcript_27663/m.69743 type:complete len:406 (+) Transcript_27663:219-1436(+)|eukprot:CAMPEP_0178993828 /NCGR_PEP_ID=MMETSP0795-20121207/6928_1 /TAXON_ID=88552 /ORGANISM="Amoebophrya sp., Strain Ameob2" /LENGTH=405 /DNA_ID=CAMNT_0020685947 /DNA_START=209 /DNA_END=1426 /DNA_ORIENTATION=+